MDHFYSPSCIAIFHSENSSPPMKEEPSDQKIAKDYLDVTASSAVGAEGPICHVD
jgi:hypothetical protein